MRVSRDSDEGLLGRLPAPSARYPGKCVVDGDPAPRKTLGLVARGCMDAGSAQGRLVAEFKGGGARKTKGAFSSPMTTRSFIASRGQNRNIGDTCASSFLVQNPTTDNSSAPPIVIAMNSCSKNHACWLQRHRSPMAAKQFVCSFTIGRTRPQSTFLRTWASVSLLFVAPDTTTSILPLPRGVGFKSRGFRRIHHMALRSMQSRSCKHSTGAFTAPTIGCGRGTLRWTACLGLIFTGKRSESSAPEKSARVSRRS